VVRLAIKYASDALKNDREVVLVAVKQNGTAIKYVPHAVRDDKELVMVAVKECGFVLQHVSPVLKNDKEVVLKRNGRALRYASPALKNDKEVVLAAVKDDGGALRYASDALKNDRGMVLISTIKPLMTCTFKRNRWHHLVKTMVRFNHDDKAFADAFAPAAIAPQVDDVFLMGGFEVGPQPTPLWLAVTNKKRRRSI